LGCSEVWRKAPAAEEGNEEEEREEGVQPHVVVPGGGGRVDGLGPEHAAGGGGRGRHGGEAKGSW